MSDTGTPLTEMGMGTKRLGEITKQSYHVDIQTMGILYSFVILTQMFCQDFENSKSPCLRVVIVIGK